MSSSAKPPPENPCPTCGGEVVPIAYGLPGPDMFEAAERGEIFLGGCVIFDGQPTSRCSRCGTAVGNRTDG